ncbi:uncharacterized protein LOC110852291 isoform X2 [Folsomia candida]|uniref:uncharacterized protein LOC110852291 isoform X2 n=1 Tax=Folsomia candida TaxID=158441 RepID=UPI000B906701|nr:uncharacterized protein LOC110852291 isoform X2 [Folsomia candida]
MSASFRSILQQVTQEKLEELKLQKNLMSSHFLPVLSKVGATSGGVKDRLALLYSAVKSSPVSDSMDAVLIENLKSVLTNSAEDPSISDQLITAWTTRVQGEVEFSLRKCEYSYLYGSLLSEWLEAEERRRKKGVAEPGEVSPAEATTPSTPKADDSASRDKALSTLTSLLFTPPSESTSFNAATFRAFLSQELFSFGENVAGETVLKQVIKDTETFFKPENYYISTFDVQSCIKGLCSEELLSSEKKAALKELSDNADALEEVASLLTTRLKNLDRWEWPSNISSEPTELRRGLAGEYKPFLNEDIITALFLQYVGVEWAAYFKRQFFAIYDSKGWMREDCKPTSVEGYRGQFFRSAFLSALPNSVAEQENKNKEEYARVEAMDMEYEADDFELLSSAGPSTANFAFGGAAGGPSAPRAMLMSKKMARRAPPPPPPPPSDVDFKQQFLHLLTTEIKLNATLRPTTPLLVVQADLDSFSPSVIHDAALIALQFLGVSDDWIKFFGKFLTPEIHFGKDGAGARKVVRGVPTAHALSNLFGETLLFLLDFLVNRKCDGLRIYRISDELWFWHHSAPTITSAWTTILTFGEMIGLKVNEARSGSVSVFSGEQFVEKFGPIETSTTDTPTASLPKMVAGPAPLPQKSIHWGYLQLGSNGVWHIDTAAVAKFLTEMKTLLDKADCVLEWINIFNKYFTFFIRNFGKSAVASGKQHLDQIVTALNQIYAGLGGSGRDPVSLLRSKFAILGDFGGGELVDGWVYWPLERGGLGLVNPFIAVMALRETFAEAEKGAPLDLDFSRLPQEDRMKWEELKKQWEQNYGPVQPVGGQMFGVPHRPHPPQKLPTWEEYVASRETDLAHWYYRYLHLLERPGPKYPPVSDTYHTLGQEVRGDELERNYFMWLYSYYEPQLRGHFGSVTFINAKLLPMSMIATIQKSKVRHN